MTPLPEIDPEELKKFKEKNFQDRLEFIEWYSNQIKKKSNKECSSEQKELID